MTDVNDIFGSLFGSPVHDHDVADSETTAADAQLIPLAYQRAQVIIGQADGGLLQGDIPAEAGVLVSRGVLALTTLLEADTKEVARLMERCGVLEDQRNAALTRARAAEAEQLPAAWYWQDNRHATATNATFSNLICRANPSGGALQMVGMIPDRVQTACLARMVRLNAARPPE